MNAQQQANHYYKTAFDRWALELSYQNNHLIAKSIASYVVEQMIEALENNAANSASWKYYEEVKDEINKIRGYDNLHDTNNSANSEQQSTI
jgi:hypothetical protein